MVIAFPLSSSFIRDLLFIGSTDSFSRCVSSSRQSLVFFFFFFLCPLSGIPRGADVSDITLHIFFIIIDQTAYSRCLNFDSLPLAQRPFRSQPTGYRRRLDLVVDVDTDGTVNFGPAMTGTLYLYFFFCLFLSLFLRCLGCLFRTSG